MNDFLNYLFFTVKEPLKVLVKKWSCIATSNWACYCMANLRGSLRLGGPFLIGQGGNTFRGYNRDSYYPAILGEIKNNWEEKQVLYSEFIILKGLFGVYYIKGFIRRF